MAITRAQQAKQLLANGGDVLGPLGEDDSTNTLAPKTLTRGLAFILSGGLSDIGSVSAAAKELAKQKAIEAGMKKSGKIITPKIQTELMQRGNKAMGIGGYQSDFAQDSDFMGGKGTAAEMGSFADGGRIGLQVGGGADMGGERGPETGREPGPVGGGQGVTGDTPRGDGPATGAPSLGLISEIRRQQLEKAPDIFGRTSPTFFPKTGGDGINQVRFDMPEYLRRGFNSEKEYLEFLASQKEEKEEEKDEGLRLAFRAEGGPIGGEYDFESARQMYGLGKLVKKVTRTVKKIAKSPIGKAALLYAGTAGLGSIGSGLTGFARFAPSNFMSNVGRIGSFISGGFPGKNIVDEVALTGKKNIFQKIIGGIPGGITTAIAGASALAGLLTPEQEEEAQELARGEGIDIEEARRSILNAGTSQDFRAVRFRAEGGSMKEPVAKKTMPLLDMGGKEMDLRAEGGFVPIGRMEKADDVPARLSKNEFVFTADAVRNAGDGNVDKGAEVMYNMMKNLEAGGDVSEESQGLEGARKMFQTSKRLEEVL